MDTFRLAFDLIRVIRAGDTYLGVSTGITYNATIAARLDATAHSPCWIVNGGAVSRCEQAGYHTRGDTLYTLLPFHKGKSFLEIINMNAPDSLRALHRLAEACVTLMRAHIYITRIHLRSIIFLDNNGILFISNNTTNLMCDEQSEYDALNYSLPFNHPTLKGADLYSFALAVITYLSLCGSLPWDVSSRKEFHNHIMSGLVPHIHYYHPSVRQPIAQELWLLLSKPKQSMPPMDHWVSIFPHWIDIGVYENLNSTEIRANTRNAHIYFDNCRRTYTRFRRMRKNIKRLCIAATVILGIAYIAFFITTNDVTRHFSGYSTPIDLLSAHYQSFNNLDTKRLSQTFAHNAGTDKIDEVRTVRVHARVRMATQFQSPLVNPSEWHHAGRPELAETRALYGYDSLNFTRVAEGNSYAIYDVEYRKWFPHQFAIDRAINGPGNSVGYIGRERLYLRNVKDRWVITHSEYIVQNYF